MQSDGSKSVLVVDSGIGGMTIVKAIRERTPGVSLTYLSDNAFFPYGRLATETLAKRTSSLVEQALNRFEFDAVVIACNTASTVVLDELRQAFPVPFVGVVPPIKTAAEMSQTRVIGLLATEGTVRRPYIDTLVETFAADCTVVRIGCPDLAQIAEDKVQGRAVDTARLRCAIAPLKAMDLSVMDVIILGCTHFPLLGSELEAEIRTDILWLDPAVAVARHLKTVLPDTDLASAERSQFPSDDVIFFTGEQNFSKDAQPFYREMGFSRFEVWP